MTSTEIHAAIQRDLYPSGIGRYAYIKEFRAGTGYASASERYLDAWVMQCWPSGPMLAIGIEIKISRSDWAREIRKPMKRDSALRITNQFYVAAPTGMITEAELPNEAGLIEVEELAGVHFKASIVVQAPHREFDFTWPFIASLARRVAGEK